MLEETEENHTIVDNSTKIATGDLPNVGIELYHHVNVLGVPLTDK
jgi:hypothetical protein